MNELKLTGSGYIDHLGQEYKIVSGSLVRTDGLGIAPAIIGAAIQGGIVLTKMIAANKGLNKKREETGQLQLVYDTLAEQNRQLDLQIAQLREALRQAGLSGLGALGKFFLFNSKKKNAELDLQASLTVKIAAAKKEQEEKLVLLQNLQGQLQRAGSGNGLTSQASIGWGVTGLLMASLIGGYFYNEYKVKKKGKGSKK